jgi:hypothetical protein
MKLQKLSKKEIGKKGAPMNNDRIVQILYEAAHEAEAANTFNKETTPTIRCSRAGLPLMQQILEDKVIPNLPPLLYNFWQDKEEDDASFLTSNQSQIKREMAIAQGYLFERVVAASLSHEHPTAEIKNNVPLSYKGLEGHCDFLVVKEKEQEAIVVECKALGAFSQQEAQEKVNSDNYGYYSQLSLYQAAVHELFPSFIVKGEWRVWNKRQEQALRIPYEGGLEEALQVANKAVEKAKLYEEATRLFEEKQDAELVSFLFSCSEPFPAKKQTRAYYLSTCSFHFSPWSHLLLNEDGKLKPQAKANLQLMIAASQGNKKALEEVVKKIKKLNLPLDNSL